MKYINIDENLINKDLYKYLQKNIIPLYDSFDGAHDFYHVKEVIEYSMLIAKALEKFKNVDINYNIVLTIAAFHDTGLMKNRDKHEIYSAKYVTKHLSFLKNIFNKEEIKIIVLGCKEHRASKHNPTTIYSKIVADGDKCGDADIRRIIHRAWYFRKDQFDNYSDKEIFEQIFKHIEEKYSDSGYAKFSLDITKKLMKKKLKERSQYSSNKEKCYILFKKMRSTGILRRKR